ncbi:MAG: uroporphyrinogen-III synthase [Halomonas sp.]|nr:uroporphyrinogen-III synthase [Halomonas sp.]
MADQPVVITRPGERGDVLAAAIEACGLPVMRLESLRLEALPETPEQRAVWLDIDQFRRVVVVSPFAAECLADALDRYWPQLPLGSSLQCLVGEKSLLVAGEGGRALLAETLAARGAQVTRLTVYRRTPLLPSHDMQRRLSQGNFRALVVSSGEILEHLARWCKGAALNQPLIVSSTRLATLASKLGFRAPVVASGATPTALTVALTAACHPQEADVDQDDLEKG